MKIPPVNCKVFERNTILKNGRHCNLKIKSEIPRTFQFDMVELNSKQEVPLQYHSITRKGDKKSAYRNYFNVMDKLDRCCEDDNLIQDIAEFFQQVLCNSNKSY